jgi:membrane-bound ClpP family serine protease
VLNGIEALLGEQGVVSSPIPGSIHLGAVRARGEDWPAVSAVGNPISEGEVVLILEVDRGHLVVAPVGDSLV